MGFAAVPVSPVDFSPTVGSDALETRLGHAAQPLTMLRLIALLLLVPLLDMLLLVVLTGYVGWVVVVLLVVLTALVGTLLVRAEGRHTLRKIQERLARGEVPTKELLDGALLLVSGVLLLTPGLVTDAIGFLLVIPVTRYPIRAAVQKWVVTPYIDAKTGGFATGGVYIGGFPGGDDGPGGDVGSAGTGGPDPSSGPGETVDLDEEGYDVSIDEDRDR